jgi:hypothetical protein
MTLKVLKAIKEYAKFAHIEEISVSTKTKEWTAIHFSLLTSYLSFQNILQIQVKATSKITQIPSKNTVGMMKYVHLLRVVLAYSPVILW